MRGASRRGVEPGDSCSDVQNLSAAASPPSPGADILEMSSRAGAPSQGMGHYREGVQGRSSLHHWTQPLGIFAAGFCQGVCALPGHGIDLEGAERLLQKGTERNNQHDDAAKNEKYPSQDDEAGVQ